MKRVTLVLALCALALAIPLSAVAGNGPNNKVTGDMWFTNPGFGLAHFTFSGHDVPAPGVDKGTASYSDIDGSWTGTTTNVTVNQTSGTMVVTVTSSTHPSVPVGSQHTFTFVDGGEPGTSDYFTYNFGGHYAAEAGNIQVHYSS